MGFTDMRNFTRLAPEQYKDKVDISADYDSLRMTIQGFTIGLRVDERQPYRLIRIGSAESPVEFVAVLHFEPGTLSGQTEVSIDLDANLNFMMKTMLGGKIQDVLDKIVDGLADASNGKMPNMPDNIF